MKYALLFCILSGSDRSGFAQEKMPDDQVLTAFYHHFAGHEPRLSGDDRLGEPIWKATLIWVDTTVAIGYAAFMDNDLDENEVTWSPGFGQTANLQDALWTIQSGQSNPDNLIIYSDGEVFHPTGNLLTDCYTFSYERSGKSLTLTLKRPGSN